MTAAIVSTVIVSLRFVAGTSQRCEVAEEPVERREPPETEHRPREGPVFRIVSRREAVLTSLTGDGQAATKQLIEERRRSPRKWRGGWRPIEEANLR